MTELYADTLPELLAPRGFAPAPPVERAVEAALAGAHAEALELLAAAEAALAPDAHLGRMLVLHNRAQLRLEAGALRDAADDASAALRLARRERDDAAEALAGLGLALVHLARGRRNEARSRLAESARGFARSGDALRQIQCHYLLGEVAYIGEDPIRAGAHYRDALGIARTAGEQAWIELLTLRFEHR